MQSSITITSSTYYSTEVLKSILGKTLKHERLNKMCEIDWLCEKL